MKRRASLALLAASCLAGNWDWARAADVPDLVVRSKPSLVLVGTYSETDSPRFTFHGTGFAVGDGNLAVTNMHVLPGPEDEAPLGTFRSLMVQVRRPSGEWSERAVEVIARDRAHDLVLLRFEGPAVPPFKLAASDVAREGTSIVLMGFPIGGVLGFAPVTHHGIVSSIAPIALPQSGSQGLNARAIRQLREGSFDILQLDATAYPGNSGGPVLDIASGAVIGVVNMVLVKGSRESALSQPTGISYAIPVAYVRDLIASAPK